MEQPLLDVQQLTKYYPLREGVLHRLLPQRHAPVLQLRDVVVADRGDRHEEPGEQQPCRPRVAPVGHDGGYLWRLYSYWRFLERDGGTYVQCETISLTRDVPFMVSWIVKPFVTSIPRESLTFTLETTRKALAR